MDRSLKKLEHQQQHLRQQLEQDALTATSSRTSLLRELEAAIGRAAKTGQPLVVVMADLDRFKVINDQHGHLAGDRVLKDVAARIKAALREFDLVGRYGGEEFVILLENTSLHTAHQVAVSVDGQHVAYASAGAIWYFTPGSSTEPVQLGSATVEVTISQGLAIYREGDDVPSLLKRADQAMYRAKAAGRDCVVED